jgi:chitinase
LHREYPGAPDRGGKEDDTKNYVELLKTLRSSFDRSGRDLGITFTAPSTLWYLRWFDLPGIMKYADWVNLVRQDEREREVYDGRQLTGSTAEL